MQADKAAYERIIIEKDHQLVLLKEIIKKLENSRSNDMQFLREESYKIKENQIEILESEKTAEKLSFLGLVEQLKGQIRSLEANLEGKSEENSKLKSWNMEKSLEIESFKEKIRDLEKEFEEFKEQFEEKEAISNALKEKSLLEMQIKGLRKTIENQKVMIDKLYERLGEKNEIE